MTRPTADTVGIAVQKAIDAEEATIHAILPTGESQHLRFYLVIWEVPHQDAGDELDADTTLLKERYFQLPKEGAPKELAPTFKKNGISRRDTGDLKGRLVRVYARISNSDELGDSLDPLYLPEDDE